MFPVGPYSVGQVLFGVLAGRQKSRTTVLYYYVLVEVLQIDYLVSSMMIYFPPKGGGLVYKVEGTAKLGFFSCSDTQKDDNQTSRFQLATQWGLSCKGESGQRTQPGKQEIRHLR